MTIAYQARRRAVPLRLMAFLGDAERLGLLRSVGAVYQFRHAAFQDHLSAAFLARARGRASASDGPVPGPHSSGHGASVAAGALIVGVGVLAFEFVSATTAGARVVYALLARAALLGLGWAGVRAYRSQDLLLAPWVVALRRVVPATWFAALVRWLTVPSWRAALRRRRARRPPR